MYVCACGYVSICMCMYVCIVCLCACVCRYVYNVCVCVLVCVHVCMSVCGIPEDGTSCVPPLSSILFTFWDVLTGLGAH